MATPPATTPGMTTTTGGTTSSGLSDWAQPYIVGTASDPGYLTKAKALGNKGYEAYGGPLTAGTSDLQTKAFQGIGGLSVPSSIGTAATTAGNVANKFAGMSYNPSQFGNQFAAPGAYQTGDFSNQFNAPGAYQTGQFASQYQGPDQYQAGQFDTGTFGADQAQQYMNPYLQSALNPQLEEARRQSQITQLGNQAKATQAGAFGGGRQAIMDAETQRALGSNLANITGQGYNTAYDKAMGQFNADQARQMQAQQAGEQSRQFGATQAATTADLMAKYGMSAQQAQEASRQFGAGQAMTAAQQAAQYGLSAQQGREASRQFGAGQGMTAAQQAAQYGLAGQQEAEKSKQFGANYGLESLKNQLAAAQAQGQLGLTENTANLANLQQQLTAGDAQRKIEAEGVKADLDEFNVQREFPYKQIQFQRDILSGLPVSAITSQAPQMNDVAALVASMGGMPNMIKTAEGNPSVKKLLKYLGLDLDEAT